MMVAEAFEKVRETRVFQIFHSMHHPCVLCPTHAAHSSPSCLLYHLAGPQVRINPGNFADGRKSFEVINYDDPKACGVAGQG